MNELKIFENQEFGKVRMVEIDGKPYAVGVDVARALGYENATKAVINHCKNIRKEVLEAQSQNGMVVKTETNLINEGDIYRLIVKAADQSKNTEIKAKAEKFERWIFDEVIPSIRKHGAYMTPEKLEEALLNPDAMIKVLTELKKEREERAKLQQKIEEQKPKVLFADAVATAKNSILVGELAKLLKQNGIDIGQNRLFQWLRDNGYLIKRKGTDYNMPTQYAMELGLFEVKETTITHADGHISISKTPKVTGKGQIYFINKFSGQDKPQLQQA
ncbi:MAG: hypothetical protein JG776_493 [Caloramator sp.]|uniref:phage antirepressor KilAC domain-containing protein n=1 Tax=Caloramator sp. TaxID=1871330 RepID=UPI001E1140FB|nr:phage antirepressor KilAC domain-containing protein [Caloramator sp.]MBZ4662811.1 hypothetical protein [Caloramator sp.]